VTALLVAIVAGWISPAIDRGLARLVGIGKIPTTKDISNSNQ
jgi:hypothetical protein